jgi:hypothetical protein
VALLRVLAFLGVAVVAASLILRVPVLPGLTVSTLSRGTFGGVTLSFHLTADAWGALVAAVCAFGCTLPLAVRIR